MKNDGEETSLEMKPSKVRSSTMDGSVQFMYAQDQEELTPKFQYQVFKVIFQHNESKRDW